ncbi:MAG: UvrD-helicase domain-containing protein [Gammaproteobacteria bacterium]|nr:UvrD-helicase domain-containing protein [Gammaproteobacteria bacterium]
MNKLVPETFPLHGHQLIEASAGTGKTYTITNLYLRLLLGRDEALDRELAADQILVLTFTIAATEELRGRIRTRINEARDAFAAGQSDDTFLAELVAGSEDATRDMRLLASAVQLMDEASIFTIHGFCARVLADNAFETGMLFDQALDADRDELLEQAVRDCFRADILQLPRFHRHAALDLWPSPDSLSRATKPFLFRPSLELTPPRRDIDENALLDRIRRLKQRWLDEDFESVIRNAKFNGATRVIKRLPDMTEWCRSDALDTDLWSLWSSQTLINTRLNNGGALPDHPLIDEIDALVAEFSRSASIYWHLVIDRNRHYLERYKEEQARLTLDDLLTRVHAAQLAPGGDVLSRSLAARWPVALIDEFQDTDDIQWEIFSHIYKGRGQGLFLIGDPKQAIYQFRGADVFTYINAKREIDSRFSLDTNWRSRPPVIEAVNALFDQPAIFDNDDDIPFEPVHPSPNSAKLTMTEGGYDIAPISLFRVPADRANKDKVRRLPNGFGPPRRHRGCCGANEVKSKSMANHFTQDRSPSWCGVAVMQKRPERRWQNATFGRSTLRWRACSSPKPPTIYALFFMPSSIRRVTQRFAPPSRPASSRAPRVKSMR